MFNEPCLQCVVEYLEANLKFRLSSRCPEIRSIERSVPLHLDLLEFGSTRITINHFHYMLKKNVTKKIRDFTPGDIAFYDNDRKDEEDFVCSYQIVRSFFGRNEKILMNFPEGFLKNEAMKWMGCFFFEGRQVITTKKLEVMSVNVLRLPSNFKVKVINQIETSMEYLDGISEFVQPKVEEIVIFFHKDVVQEHSFIRNAEQLSFKGLSFLRTDDFLNFPHKNVKLTDPLPAGYFERLIRKWIADEREIGSSFSFIEDSEHYGLRDLCYYKKMFGGRAVDRKVTKEEITSFKTSMNHFDRFEKEMEYRKSNKGRNLLYCICLQMNSTSELQISLFGRNQWAKESKVDLEVVPIESLPTLEFDQVAYQIQKENFKEEIFFGLLILFFICSIGILIYYAPQKGSAS